MGKKMEPSTDGVVWIIFIYLGHVPMAWLLETVRPKKGTVALCAPWALEGKAGMA